MTPTKEVPTWEELVERLTVSFYANGDPGWGEHWTYGEAKDFKDASLADTDRRLRAAGLTPEILEDARAGSAVRWVEANDVWVERGSSAMWSVDVGVGPT